MTVVKVEASRKYDVLIGENIFDNIGNYAKNVIGICKALIITDTNVEPLYAKRLTDSLEKEGYEVLKYVIKAGEASKNSENFIKILNFAAENHLTRTDAIFALGGGVVGDLSGFCAASYLRGIKFVQIPTTLLASVDSSVGGKTAINLDAGKNLAGAFYQPHLVVCDPTVLETLPEDVFKDGCAEVIKTAILGDKELFEALKNKKITADIIARCVQIKRDVVCEDEHDTGKRQLLNLGHTIGHTIEKLSNFEISHGKAVAIGISVISNTCLTEKDCRESIVEMLKLYSLPTECSFSSDDIYEVALSDKKRADGNITLVIPRGIGDCILKSVSMKSLKSIIDKGVCNK